MPNEATDAIAVYLVKIENSFSSINLKALNRDVIVVHQLNKNADELISMRQRK